MLRPSDILFESQVQVFLSNANTSGLRLTIFSDASYLESRDFQRYLPLVVH